MKVLVQIMGRVSPGICVRESVTEAVIATLTSERKKPVGEINVILTDRPTIRRMNKRFLDHSGDTDVIAFPYDAPGVADAPFGDIYISIPVAIENAKRFKDEPMRELVRLAVHGTLHLLGYRDHAKKDYAVMWGKQERLVARLCPPGGKK